MIIKKVVGECLRRMGEKDFTSATQLTDEQKELQDKLIGACNIVYREIVSRYIPVYYSQKVTFEDGKTLLSSLHKKPLYIVSVKVGDTSVPFFVQAPSILAEIDGPATVKYVCLPAEYELTLTSDVSDLKVTQGAFCCGVLAEYYFQNKVFDLAKSFDTEFRVQMNELKFKGKSIVIKARRWK